MNRKMSDYGLKKSYKFKEIYIPLDKIDDFYNKVATQITPTIIELETLDLINGFHFILHQAIDLRLSCNDWNKNEKKIKEILKEHKLPENLKDCGSLSPEKYGGDIGVNLR